MINPIDIGWAAGFLEGEGSFSRTHYGGFNVEATQCQKEPLERLLILFGGSIRQGPKRINPNHNFIHRWCLSGSRAAALSMTLLVLMSPKRQQQIKERLKEWKLHRPAPEFRTHCPQGHEYTGNNIIWRHMNGRKIWRDCRECANVRQRIYGKTKRLRRMRQVDKREMFGAA